MDWWKLHLNMWMLLAELLKLCIFTTCCQGHQSVRLWWEHSAINFLISVKKCKTDSLIGMVKLIMHHVLVTKLLMDHLVPGGETWFIMVKSLKVNNFRDMTLVKLKTWKDTVSHLLQSMICQRLKSRWQSCKESLMFYQTCQMMLGCLTNRKVVLKMTLLSTTKFWNTDM